MTPELVAPLRYMGFDQAGSLRSYRFGVVSDRDAAAAVTISIDVSLFGLLNVRLQDGPMICSKIVARDGVKANNYVLTESDMRANATVPVVPPARTRKVVA